MHVLEEHIDSFLLGVHLGMKLLNQKVSVYLAVVLLPAFQNGGTSPRRKEPQLHQWLVLPAFIILIIFYG